MKRLLIAPCLIAFILCMLSTNASADSVNFGDTKNQWSNDTTLGSMPNVDVYGTPNIIGGIADINENGTLNSVTINMISMTPYWQLLEPGSLFIDRQADGIWDYLVDTAADNPGASDPSGSYALYEISQPFNDATTNGNYLMSIEPAGATIREDAPISMKDEYLSIEATLVGTAVFSGWPAYIIQGSSASITYSQFSFDIALDEKFTISWMPTCANDVLLETLDNPTGPPNDPPPVPEPATMLLFGTGLVGLAGIRRKYRKK